MHQGANLDALFYCTILNRKKTDIHLHVCRSDNEVVNIVRQFNDAFQSVTARREIKKKLRSILWVKYQIKDNDVFERAYQYIEMYY